MNAKQDTENHCITVKFRAPLDDSSEEEAKREINYEAFRGVKELELLQSGQFDKYAYMQVLKICYYMQKVRNREVLQMTAEFVRDNEDNIWFVHANQI